MIAPTLWAGLPGALKHTKFTAHFQRRASIIIQSRPSRYDSVAEHKNGKHELALKEIPARASPHDARGVKDFATIDIADSPNQPLIEEGSFNRLPSPLSSIPSFFQT
jgi:hypothetical protein